MTSEQGFNCVFCEDVFDNKEDLQVHFRKHGDPGFNKKNKCRITNDSEMASVKPTENVEMVGCDVCSEVFTTISKAITHKHKIHPDHDAKYFCPWCGKLFTMKHLYNKHMQSNHNDTERPDDKDFHCDCCDVDFYIPSAVTYHNKFFHRQDTDLPDIGQSKKLKLHNGEAIPIYYCAFCGEEYDNKVNLYKHTTDDHSDENQSPEEVLRCPLCEAIFYHLDAYEVHLTFHTTDDLYSTETIMCGDLHEYSLESLPPVLEKVENLETQGDAETTINSVGIDKFLELTMDQSQDSASVKSKKHKKHKKSKKSAITLDEFLSMNKDVFGEGLDFQGIEEVPTRVVTKRLKSIKKPINTVSPLEIEKLKQQGIVVKKKVSQNPNIHGIKVLKGISEKPRNIVKNPISNKMKSAIEVTTSEEVLSKLLTQSNNEIKIVKKSIQDNIKPKAEQSPTLTSVKDDKTIQKVKAEYASGEEENINDKEDLNKISSSAENNTTLVPPTNTQEFSEPVSTYAKDNSICETDAQMVDQDNQSDTEIAMVRTDVLNSTNSNHSPNQENSQCNVGMLNINMNTLPNKTQAVVKSKANEIIKSQLNQDNDCFLESNQKDNVSDNEAEIDEFRFDNLEEDKDKFTMPNSTNTSLSALKNLNHNITIKPLSQTKITTHVVTDAPVPVKETDGELLIKNQVRNTSKPIALPGPVEKETVTVKQNNSDPNLDALKKLRKNITIKSYSKHVPGNSSDEDVTEAEKETENKTSKEISAASVTESQDKIRKNINSSQNEPKFLKPLNSSNIGYKASSLNASKINIPNSDNCIKAKNDNILKRLPNITTKPVTSQKVEQIICKPSIIPTKIINQQNEGEIEIFNIDDSDDDENENNLSNQHTELPTIAKPVNALKKLNKNITIKSVNQQSIQSNIKMENNMDSDEEHGDEEYNAFMHDSDSDDTTVNMKRTKVMFTKSCSQKLANKNISIKNALQTLGKNITVKSRNSSPNLPLQEHSSQDSNVDTNEGSDSDSNSGKVKITEMDEHASDDEIKPENYMQNSSDAIVQSPDASGSEDNEDPADFENEIKASTVQKQQLNSKNPILINTLKNLGKNITIKSLSEQNDKEDKSDPEIPDANIKKQMPIKQSPKQNQSESAIANKNSKRHVQAEHSSNQSVNQKMSMSSSNQVNTVNKEVTVKTFQTQTKTVIQEITTTVTKTIKTVNQTTKQEIQNSRQINSPIKTQRIQGMRPSQSNNLQGIVVRHASPLVGTKMGNSSTQIRTGGTMIRPSKQIVPVRPGLSGVRPSTPRLPVVRKPIPVASQQNQVIGRPLKISPNALTTTPSIVKRHSEELTGPFSCFKKPKESLIPVSEVSGETVAQYASTSHCSTSNSTSTIKVVKGNSVVTSTQMKSEMCSNAQQISRLSNNSGLKVVKTSQAKQQQTQEKSETNAMKRTTLAAIEKLQKQGLLVKKPRLDVNEDSEHSDVDDENLGYSSNEEQNE